MQKEEVRVPVSLLLARELTAADKLVWLALELDAHLEERALVSPTRLAGRTGLSRPTTRKATARLATAGWWPVNRRTVTGTLPEPRVAMPAELIRATKVSAQAKVVYGALQATPDYRHPAGVFTYSSFARMMNLGTKTVKRAVRQLAALGWLEMEQANKHAPIRFKLRNPVAARTMAELLRIQRHLEKAPFRGEALKRAWLSLIVDSEAFQDNASPGFLVNPITDGRLEIDRFYFLANVAFEFNGPQHYGPTERYGADVVAKQQTRDKIKREICAERGIMLVVIHAEDLCLSGMVEKVQGLLPLRDLQGKGKIIRYLELHSRLYRQVAQRGWASTDSAADELPVVQEAQ